MNLKYFFFCLFFCLHYLIKKCNTVSTTFFSIERPAVHWYDTSTFKNLSMTSRRASRQDPRHYVEMYVQTLVTITNDLKLDIYFYQFLTNRYRPSFVEMHFGFCDMAHTDPIFGQAIFNAGGGQDCPVPPGEYDLKNMTIPYVPKSFPFTKGRIYCNASISRGGAIKYVARLSIDMEIKAAKINKS